MGDVCSVYMSVVFVGAGVVSEARVWAWMGAWGGRGEAVGRQRTFPVGLCNMNFPFMPVMYCMSPTTKSPPKSF